MLISLTLFIAMCTIIIVFWYPGILFRTEGGWQGVRLIAGIDFIVGPVLTLIVFSPYKPSLRFDLTIIGLMQTICITYGMYIVHYSRPAVIAYADGIYYTVPLLRFDSRGIDITQNNYLQKNSLPAWVSIKLPDDKQARLKVKMERLQKGLETSINLYEPYEKALPVLPREGFSVKEARQAGINIPDDIDEKNMRVFKLITRYNTYAVLVDTSTGRFIKLLSVVSDFKLGLELK